LFDLNLLCISWSAMSESVPSRDARRPRWHGYAQLALILLAVAAAVYFAQAPRRSQQVVLLPEQTAAGPVPVQVVSPEVTAVALPVALTGAVWAQAQVRVRAEGTGRIVWVSPNFREGGTLAADEVIVRLDPEDVELRVQAAAASVRAAEAMVRFQKARADAGRRLFGSSAPDVDGFDWVGRDEAVAAMEARLDQARALLTLAERELDKTSVSLPFASHVITAVAEVGQLIGPLRTALGVVYRVGALEVAAQVHPRDLALLEPVIGRAAQVQTEGGSYTAVVARVSSVVDSDSRMATLHLELQADRADGLKPGMFAEIEIAGALRENVYRLPHTVRQDDDSVWIVVDDTLRSVRPTVVGDTAAGWVVEAFDAGAGVVVSVPARARDGLAVTAAVASR
jgi:RND family efflux transporter MFP subunit